jgi:hypothetical protein
VAGQGDGILADERMTVRVKAAAEKSTDRYRSSLKTEQDSKSPKFRFEFKSANF